MNSLLEHLLEEYAELERGVQELVSAQCRPICELCTTCCCRADICEEALESPFLRRLHGRSELESDRYGFLTATGCALNVGRPPVCYEFFCGDVLGAMPDALHSQLLRILGALPMHAGQNAHNGAHLTEIRREADLDQADFQTLEKQMQESFQCLEILRGFFNEGTLPEDAGRVLNRIALSEE
jgi:hypothetical protein